MNNYYDDIIKKIDEEPQWFDEAAVPRYCKFSPKELADIYADECALVLIACQDCRHEFKVAFSQDMMGRMKWEWMYKGLGGKQAKKNLKAPTIAESIRDKTIHYGDPPNIRCCPAGPTMNCDDIKVLEYWERNSKTNHEWKRKESLEIDLGYSYFLGIERVDK
jgi:hypothetical protein